MRPSEADCCGEDGPLVDGRPEEIVLEQGKKEVGTLLEGTINDSKASSKLTSAGEVWFPGIGRRGDGGWSSIGGKRSDARPSSCSLCMCMLAGRGGMAMTFAALFFLLCFLWPTRLTLHMLHMKP